MADVTAAPPLAPAVGPITLTRPSVTRQRRPVERIMRSSNRGISGSSSMTSTLRVFASARRSAWRSRAAVMGLTR